MNFGVYNFEIRFHPSCNINLVLLTPQRRQKSYLLTHRTLKYNISVTTGIAS